MKKTLTFEFPRIQVEVDTTEGMSNTELLELGKKALSKKFASELPKGFKWGMTEGTVIDDNDVVSGRPLKLKSTGEVGIVYEVKHTAKYPVRILINGNKDLQCTKEALEKVSKNTSIEKLIKGRQEFEKDLGWLKTRTAFFVNKGEIIPVIVHVPGRGKSKAIVVGHEVKGSFYELSELSMTKLFDTKTEAEEFLRVHK